MSKTRKVRIVSATPVVIGHKRLLPGEVHEVAKGDLQAVIATYGEDAFLVLDAPAESEQIASDTPPVTEVEGGGQASDELAVVTGEFVGNVVVDSDTDFAFAGASTAEATEKPAPTKRKR